MNRKASEWECVIQCEDGRTLNRKVRSFWSTEKDFITSHSIATTAAAQEFVVAGKQKRFVGISAQLLPTTS